MIVISIIVLIATIGAGFYTNYGKSVEINAISSSMVSDLKQVRSKSMINEGGFKWGIHFVNGDKDYYEIFSTPTDYTNSAKVITSTNYLSGGVNFLNPASGASKDIIFNKISGGTSESSVVFSSSNVSKIINISSIGNISISDVSSEESSSSVYNGGPNGFDAIGLRWDGNDSSNTMTWDNANTYCASLGSGWRLPSKDELVALYNVNGSKPSGFATDYYWSSTGDSDNAFIVYMGNGFVGGNWKARSYYFRCVH